MGKALRLLNVEDSEADVILLEHHLTSAGYELTSQTVKTAVHMKAALKAKEWDIILCDYSMPGFDALKALSVLRESGLDIPLIVISGTVGEEVAVEAMLTGANDYLPKGNLARLEAAVEREVREANNRRERRIVEERLKASEAEMRALFAAMSDVILVLDSEGRHLKVAPTNPAHVYARGTYRIGKTVHEIFPPVVADFILSNVRRSLDEARTFSVEYPLRIDGKDLWYDGTVTPMSDDSVVWVARDITERRHDENERRIIFEITQGAITSPNLDEFLKLVHRSISHILYAENCFVMLHDPVTDMIQYEFWADKYDPLPPPRPAGKGFGSYVLCTGQPLLLTEESKKRMFDQGEAEQVGSSSASWMGVPLRTPSRTIGVLVLQHYEDEHAYSERDLEFLASIGDQIALAIERKRADEALNKSEDRYRDLVEHSHDLICTHDLDGRVLSVNQTAAEILGYDRDALQSRNIRAILLPEFSEGFDDYIAELQQKGIARGVMSVRTRNGENRVWEYANTLRVKDVAEPIVRGVARDVTEQRRAEAALRMSEESYRDLVENAIDMIYTLDLDGNYTSVNRAGEKLTGYSRDEAITMTVGQFAAPEYLEKAKRMRAAMFAGEDVPAYELEIIAKDGHRVAVELNTRIIYKNAVAVGVQGVARDITERKRAENERRIISEIIQAAVTTPNLDEFLKLVHRTISQIVYAENCFVMLHDPVSDLIHYEFWVDKYDSPPPPHLASKGFSGYVLRTSQPLLLTEELRKRMCEQGDAEQIGRPSPSWLGVPLLTPSRTIGVLVLQHYEDEHVYSERDLEFVSSVGDQIALAIERKRADEELRESEEKYRTILERIEEGYAEVDIAGTYVFVNDAFCHITGRTADELLGVSYKEFFDGEQRKLLRDTYHNVYLTGEPVTGFEYKVTRKDGTIRIVEESVILKRDAEGQPIGFTGIRRDCTDRKREESALLESEERYRDLVENAIDMIYTQDLDGNYTSINRAAEKITGYTREETLTRNMADSIAPEQREKIAAQMKAAILSGTEATAYELEIIAKDGRRVAVEVNTRVIHENGIPVGVQGIARDTTERKRAEEALRKTQRRIEDIVNSVDGIVWEADAETVIFTFVSKQAEQILGYPVERWLNDPAFWSGHIHPDDRDAAVDLCRRAAKNLTPHQLEYRMLADDGCEVWLRDVVTVFAEAGRPVKLRGIMTDITGRKAEEESRLASERKYQDIFNLAPVGIYRSLLDGTLLTVNNALAEMLGYDSASELLNTNIAGFYFNQDERDELVTKYLEIGRVFDLDLHWKRKDGSPIWVQLTCRVITGTTDGQECFEGFVRDVTEYKLVENALRESNEKFHQLADNITDAFWIRSLDLRELYYVSPAFERIWGRSVESLYADPEQWANFVLPDDRERVATAFTSLTGDEPDLDIEYRIVRPDGEIRWVRVRGFPVRDAAEKLIRYAGIVTDVTERKQSDEALRESEARLRAIIETEPECVKLTTADCAILEMNPAGLHMIEADSFADVKNRDISTVVVKEHRRAFKELTKSVFRGETGTLEFQIVGLKGARRWMDTHASPLRDGAGKITALLAITRDVTERKKADQKFKDLLESAPDAMILVNGDGKIALINGQTEKLFGWRREELLGQTIEAIVPERFRGNHPNRRANFFANPKARSMGAGLDLSGLRKDGTEFPLEISLSPIETEEGTMVMSAIRDTTESKRAADELRESEEKYRMILENIEDGYYELDVAGSFTFFNDSLCRIIGYSPDELLGMNNRTYMDEENARKVYQTFNEVYRTGKPAQAFDWEIIRKDGTMRSIEASVSQREDSTGQPIGFRGIVRDITERKRAEEELSEANQRAVREYEHLLTRVSTLAVALGSVDDLQEIFRKLRDFAVFSTPMSGLFISFFDADRNMRTPVFAWSEGEEVDVSTLPEMEMNSTPHSRAVSAGEVIITDDFQSAIKGQPAINLGLDVNPILPQSSLVVPMAVMGKIIGAVEVQSTELAAFRPEHVTALQMAANLAANAIENVRLLETEGRQAEQLQQSQKMEAVGVLAGGIAHDFNNLLTAINGYSDLTLKKMAADDPLRLHIQEVKNAGVRAAELTSQLLAFSRKQVLKSVVLCLNAVVADFEGMLRRIIKENIDLRVVLDPKLGNIRGDAGQIEQVIMNLATNARDAMPNGGTLTIKTQNVYLDEDYVSHHINVSSGEFVKLTVTDTGEGMDAATQLHIFEPFFTTKEVGKGTGLGLSTVYGIVKQSGGDIMVYSEIGHGTTFKIYLPCIDEAADKPKWTGERKQIYSGTETILLVEDEEIVRNLVREILTDNGYTVLEAAGGKAALSICETYAEPIHLLLTDVIMPTMGGSELKDLVVKLRPDICVLFMSGYTDDSIAHRGIYDADIAFIEKPFTPDALARKIREVLEY